MSVELYQDQFGSIQHYPNEKILELRWSLGTENISDDDFKRWLKMLGEHAIERQTRFLVVDVREFRGTPSPEAVGSWRDEHVIPLYNQAGTEKFAFLVPPSPPASDSEDDDSSSIMDESEGPANFPTQYFPSWDAIRAWFAE